MSVTLNVNNYVVSDCESLWTTGANVTATLDTDAKRDTYSNKFVIGAAATAGQLVAYKDIPSLDLTTATTIKLWLKSSVDTALGDLQFHLDNTAACASPLETINIPALVAGVWKECTLTIATPANLTAIISIGIKYTVDKGAANLYVDDVRADKASRTYSELSVRGANDFDSIRKFPSIQRTLLDGSVKKTRQSYARDITIDVGVLTLAEDRWWLLQFVCSDDISITYASETISCILLTDDSYQNTWLDNSEIGRSYSFQLTEKTVHPMSYRPSSWT